MNEPYQQDFRYFVTWLGEAEREINQEEWQRAERAGGFNAPEGHNATAGFTGHGVSGRIEIGRPGEKDKDADTPKWHLRTIPDPELARRRALVLLGKWHHVEGDHHLRWVIHEAIRALTGCPEPPSDGVTEAYAEFIARYGLPDAGTCP